jgi:benzoyl-CoA reductase/2-hydroxyglutaryl-CoA dehydratase subunit BcrC/BadD/HgdB
MLREIVYSCPFVPGELIEACGMAPRRIVAAVNSSRTAPGVCPYAHAFGSEAAASDAAAIVVTTMCDQMRRAAEVISRGSATPVFLMNVPHTQTPSARELYRQEIERLGTFLQMHGGSAPNLGLLAEIMLSREADGTNPAASGIPIALIGGPLPASSPVVDLIERAGAYVALDGTENGERTRPVPFDLEQVRTNPIGALAEAYFAIPDPFHRPNGGFFNWVKRGVEERGVRAVILRRYVWCDTWHAEAQRIRELTDLPFLQIDVGDEGDDPARTLTRMQSLMEMLR